MDEFKFNVDCVCILIYKNVYSVEHLLKEMKVDFHPDEIAELSVGFTPEESKIYLEDPNNAYQVQIKIMKLFIKYGINCNILCGSFIRDIVERNDYETLSVLKDYGFNFEPYKSFLMAHVMLNNDNRFKVVDFLVDNSVDINGKHFVTRESLLYRASAKCCDMTLVHYLLEKGVDITLSRISIHAISRDSKILDIFLHNEKLLNDEFLYAAIITLKGDESKKIIQILLDAGAKITKIIINSLVSVTDIEILKLFIGYTNKFPYDEIIIVNPNVNVVNFCIENRNSNDNAILSVCLQNAIDRHDVDMVRYILDTHSESVKIIDVNDIIFNRHFLESEGFLGQILTLKTIYHKKIDLLI